MDNLQVSKNGNSAQIINFPGKLKSLEVTPELFGDFVQQFEEDFYQLALLYYCQVSNAEKLMGLVFSSFKREVEKAGKITVSTESFYSRAYNLIQKQILLTSEFDGLEICDLKSSKKIVEFGCKLRIAQSRQKLVLILFDVIGLTRSQVATVVGVSSEHVSNILSRARHLAI